MSSKRGVADDGLGFEQRQAACLIFLDLHCVHECLRELGGRKSVAAASDGQAWDCSSKIYDHESETRAAAISIFGQVRRARRLDVIDAITSSGSAPGYRH
jgi:hypothetical protein